MGGGYEKVGSPSDTVNVNAEATQNLQNLLTQTLGQYSAQGQQLASGLANGNFDFLNILSDPRLNQSLQGYSDTLFNSAQEAADRARQDIASKYAGTGLYSGAFGDALGQGIGTAYGNTAAQIAQTQTGLYNTAMQTANQNNAAALSYYGGLQSQALSGLTSLGQPHWYEQTYAYKPGFADYAMQGLGSIAMLGSAFSDPLMNLFNKPPSMPPGGGTTMAGVYTGGGIG